MVIVKAIVGSVENLKVLWHLRGNLRRSNTCHEGKYWRMYWDGRLTLYGWRTNGFLQNLVATRVLQWKIRWQIVVSERLKNQKELCDLLIYLSIYRSFRGTRKVYICIVGGYPKPLRGMDVRREALGG